MDNLEIYGLMFACPFCDENEDCPFIEIRTIKNLTARLEFIEKTSFTIKENFVNHHRNCSFERQKKIKLQNSK